jgi:hypothetical protein
MTLQERRDLVFLVRAVGALPYPVTFSAPT